MSSDFPPHLLGLEFIGSEASQRLFSALDRPLIPGFGPKRPLRLGLAADSPPLRAVAYEAVRQRQGELFPLLVSAVENNQQVEELLAAAPLVDLFALQFTEQRLAEKLAAKSPAPVVNLGSSRFVPCQILTDYYTISARQELDKLTYVGRVDAFCYSLMRASLLFEFELELRLPSGVEPDRVLLKSLLDRGAVIEIINGTGWPENSGVLYLGRGCEAVLDGRPGDLADAVAGPALLSMASPWRSRVELFQGSDEILYRQQMKNFARLLAALGGLLL